MNMHQPPHILCIHPPAAFPEVPSSRFEAISSALGTLPAEPFFDNAAEDFFVRILSGGEHLSSESGLTREVGRRLVSSDYRSIEEALRHSELVNRALASASSAFSPCRFHRYGFAHSGLIDGEKVMAFADDATANPFRRYADLDWHPFDPADPPDAALLYIDRPGQTGPAVSLGLSWRKRWPQIPLKLLCPESLFEGLCDASTDLLPFELLADMRQLLTSIANILPFDKARDVPADGSQTPIREEKDVPLLAAQMPEIVRAALDKGARMIIWRDCGDETAAVTRQLYAASRKGLWNHLILNGESRASLHQFAAANANIVHSYCMEEDPVSAFSDPLYNFPSEASAYGRTWPMPGKPLWMRLKDPALMSRLLDRHPLKTLMRMRVRDDVSELFEVGEQMRYHFKRPADLPGGYLDEIVRMVEAGGSVNTRFVRHNLERAYLIAYAEEEGVIIGNSSLKQPREEYIDAVSRQSGIDLHDYLERGYTSVRPEYRGLGVGAKLLEGLTRRAGDYKIFSVIAENNVATQKMAMRNRTRRVATFFSQRAKKEMSVWIPEWMLPEGIELPPQPALDIEINSRKDGK